MVTIDAMGCQTDIAGQAIQQKGDDVLALKGNQGQPHEAAVGCFDAAQAAGFAQVGMQHRETLGCGHGRIEIRTHYLTTDLRTLPKAGAWRG